MLWAVFRWSCRRRGLFVKVRSCSLQSTSEFADGKRLWIGLNRVIYAVLLFVANVLPRHSSDLCWRLQVESVQLRAASEPRKPNHPLFQVASVLDLSGRSRGIPHSTLAVIPSY